MSSSSFFVTVNHTSSLDPASPPRLRSRISTLALGKENSCKVFNHIDFKREKCHDDDDDDGDDDDDDDDDEDGDDHEDDDDDDITREKVAAEEEEGRRREEMANRPRLPSLHNV